jgi:hypothetical protein
MLLVFKGQKYGFLLCEDDLGVKCVVSLFKQERWDTSDGWFLVALSIYFGEDFLKDDTEQTFPNPWLRGKLKFGRKHLQGFLSKMSQYPFRTYPKWKNEAFEFSALFLFYGIQTGVLNMPMPLANFCTSVEAISNTYRGKRSEFSSVGESRIFKLIDEKFALMVKRSSNLNKAESLKSIKKRLHRGFDLVVAIRNKLCSHYIVYQKKNEVQVLTAFRMWYASMGYPKAKISKAMRGKTVRMLIEGEADGLFKFALTFNRVALFMYLNIYSSIPFAEYDFLNEIDLDCQERYREKLSSPELYSNAPIVTYQ